MWRAVVGSAVAASALWLSPAGTEAQGATAPCPAASGDAGGERALDGLARPVLLVWGRIDAGGRPELDAAFFVAGSPTLPEGAGPYRVEGRSEDGAALFSLAFDAPRVADGDGGSGFAFLVPAPVDWSARLASVAATGPGGGDALDRSSRRPTVLVRDRRSRRIRAVLSDPPASVRDRRSAREWAGASADQDALFSRGIPDARAWCDALEASVRAGSPSPAGATGRSGPARSAG